jgi:hypothetical protein
MSQNLLTQDLILNGLEEIGLVSKRYSGGAFQINTSPLKIEFLIPIQTFSSWVSLCKN